MEVNLALAPSEVLEGFASMDLARSLQVLRPGREGFLAGAAFRLEDGPDWPKASRHARMAVPALDLPGAKGSSP